MSILTIAAYVFLALIVIRIVSFTVFFFLYMSKKKYMEPQRSYGARYTNSYN